MADFDSVIPAGRSGKLVAKIHTKPSYNGKLGKHINVQTSAVGSENFRLEVTADVAAPIIMSPRYQVHISTMVGEKVSERILLHRRDGKKLELEAVEDAPEGVVYSLSEVKEADASVPGVSAQPGDVWLEVTVGSSSLAATAAHRAVFKTNQPDMPEVTVPITVRVRELIEPRPAQVRLWITDQPVTGSGMSLRLNHNRAEAFEITEVTSSRPELFKVTPATSGAEKMHTLRVELVPDLDLSTLNPPEQGEIIVKTSDPNTPTITVPVVVMQKSREGGNRRLEPAAQNPARRIPGTLVMPTRTPGTS